jgi:hypothetical protein
VRGLRGAGGWEARADEQVGEDGDDKEDKAHYSGGPGELGGVRSVWWSRRERSWGWGYLRRSWESNSGAGGER